MEYRTLWVVRHVMPDDRLAQAQVDPDDGVITIALRYGHIHRDLARTMAIFSMMFAQTGLFELDPGQAGQRPELQAWFEQTDERFTDGDPMRAHFGGRGPWFFNLLVRDDMVDKALIREMNEEVMPIACGILVPASYVALSASRCQARSSDFFGVRNLTPMSARSSRQMGQRPNAYSQRFTAYRQRTHTAWVRCIRQTLHISRTSAECANVSKRDGSAATPTRSGRSRGSTSEVYGARFPRS